MSGLRRMVNNGVMSIDLQLQFIILHHCLTSKLSFIPHFWPELLPHLTVWCFVVYIFPQVVRSTIMMQTRTESTVEWTNFLAFLPRFKRIWFGFFALSGWILRLWLFIPETALVWFVKILWHEQRMVHLEMQNHSKNMGL